MSATQIQLVFLVSAVTAFVTLNVLESVELVTNISDPVALALIIAIAVIPTALYHYSPLPNHPGVVSGAGFAINRPKYDSWGWTSDDE